MRVLVIGAGGAVGRRLVPKLVAAGHDVVAASRSASVDGLSGAAFRPVDLLDAPATTRLVLEVQPDAIIHQATALTGLGNNLRRFDHFFATTNRLRTEGTRTLLEAAKELPTSPRLIVQSFCGWPWAPVGGQVKTETDDWDPDPAPSFRRTFAALREMEELVTGYRNGVILRYAALYGPGTSLTRGGAQIEAIRSRTFPLVGDAGATWSFLHVEDAAAVAVSALTHGSGVYNIADDHPARVTEWLPALADMTGSPPPRHIPVWLAKLAGGKGLVHMMTRARGSSNAKARRELHWEPSRSHWRDGFAQDLADLPQPA